MRSDAPNSRSSTMRGPGAAETAPALADPFVGGTDVSKRTPSVEERLLRRIQEEDSGCWVWTGFRSSPQGYGGIKIGGVRLVAHRVAYETWVGPIPAGLQLDHLCRNRPCVNPAHLEPVTRQENMRRAYAAVKSPTHCMRGHLRSENDKPRKGGYTVCRACISERRRERLARLAAPAAAETAPGRVARPQGGPAQ